MGIPVKLVEKTAQLPQPKRSEPRFGWVDSLHRSIESVAPEWMPDSSFKTFLSRNAYEVSFHSQSLDVFQPGPAHYIGLDQLRGKKAPAHLSTDYGGLAKCELSEIEAFLPEHSIPKDCTCVGEVDPNPLPIFRSPRALKQLTAPWTQKHQGKPFRQNPFQQDNRPPNVYASTLQAYHELVALLQQSRRALATGDFRQKRQYRNELVKATARLAHYIGDLCQPFHTHDVDWRLADRKFPAAHIAADGLIIDDNQFDVVHRWALAETSRAKESHKTNGRLVNQEKREEWLAGLLNQSYRQFFYFVLGDRQARQLASSQPGTPYWQHLQSLWKPLILSQLTSATEAMATLLESAYQAAGKPDLTGFLQ